MSKMKSRIGAFLLASAMVLTMNQPVVLNAEESVNGDTVQQEIAVENSAVSEKIINWGRSKIQLYYVPN